ncbi:ribokinase [uncultured Acetatifactor sp.]|uniref:ribokinase n=1 Tax=uncultured Acetatifactor sp. TaxID=1671927 RepID=UPI002628BBB4|nr:ribokinase [uncultured Acetatifactor sp.]
MKILNFGSLNLDYVYQVEHFVQPGETLSALSQSVNCGGKGLNQSIALAKAGAEVYHAGCIGAGGERLARELAENGVDTSCLITVEDIQGNAVIQVDRSGENCILLFGGSNRDITPEMVRKVMERFEPGDYLVLQNEVSCLPEMVAEAKARGMKVVLNPSPFEESLLHLDFNAIAWLLVNEVEAEQISGKKDPDAAWQLIHGKYPGLSMVVTLGKEGAVCYTPEGRTEQKAYLSSVVDTTAAGDTFTGYFLTTLTEGMEIGECMRRASRAASISVSRAGAAVSIPGRQEVEKALEDI